MSQMTLTTPMSSHLFPGMISRNSLVLNAHVDARNAAETGEA